MAAIPMRFWNIIPPHQRVLKLPTDHSTNEATVCLSVCLSDCLFCRGGKCTGKWPGKWETESHQRPLGFSFSVLDFDIPGSEYKENVKTKTTQSEV